MFRPTQKARMLNILSDGMFHRTKDLVQTFYQYNSVIKQLRDDGYRIDACQERVHNPVNPCMITRVRGFRLIGKENVC